VLYPGFAKFGHDPGRAFLEVFVDACLASRLKGFKPQELANVINGGIPLHALSYHRGPSGPLTVFIYPGFAKLGHDPGRGFLDVFVDACLASRLQGFEPQALANVINGEPVENCLSLASQHE
jgi:hypothetical protein